MLHNTSYVLLRGSGGEGSARLRSLELTTRFIVAFDFFLRFVLFCSVLFCQRFNDTILWNELSSYILHYYFKLTIMAGLGRRTHYRKHLTDSVLNDLPEPQEDERIAKVIATRGGNHFDVLIANSSTTTPQLAILPTKFHKLVWVKRNDYVIVRTTGDDGGEGNESEEKKPADNNGGIRYMICHILYKEQVKHLKSKDLWPEDNKEFSSPEVDDSEQVVEEDDGIVYSGYGDEAEDDDADLFVNTNRINRLEIEDSSDDDSSDEE